MGGERLPAFVILENRSGFRPVADTRSAIFLRTAADLIRNRPVRVMGIVVERLDANNRPTATPCKGCPFPSVPCLGLVLRPDSGAEFSAESQPFCDEKWSTKTRNPLPSKIIFSRILNLWDGMRMMIASKVYLGRFSEALSGGVTAISSADWSRSRLTRGNRSRGLLAAIQRLKVESLPVTGEPETWFTEQRVFTRFSHFGDERSDVFRLPFGDRRRWLPSGESSPESSRLLFLFGLRGRTGG